MENLQNEQSFLEETESFLKEIFFNDLEKWRYFISINGMSYCSKDVNDIQSHLLNKKQS